MRCKQLEFAISQWNLIHLVNSRYMDEMEAEQMVKHKLPSFESFSRPFYKTDWRTGLFRGSVGYGCTRLTLETV